MLAISLENKMSSDFAMSMPFDEGMSMPFDDTMSMPLDEAMSLDLSMSITVNTDSTDPLLEETHVLNTEPTVPPLLEEAHVCDGGNPFVMVPIDFEVEIPAIYDVESFVTVIISSAIEKDFTVCPDSSRKVSNKRKLEASTVAGVKIIDVTEVDGETCDSEDSDCHVVNVEHQVLYQDGTLAGAARAEFLSKLAARLSGVHGIRQRAASTTSPTTEENDSNERDSTRGGGLSAGKIVMIVVLSVAVTSIALVVVQRKFARNTRDDDDTVVPEETIPTNTVSYAAFPLFL
jgi:hypothetical protein